MLSVIYRACGLEFDGDLKPERPYWFSKKKCWDIFHKEFLNDDIHVVWDGELNGLAEELSHNAHVNFHHIDERNNKGSLRYCYNLASDLKDAEYFYFLEDDYLHRKNSSLILKEGLTTFGLVSLYDHPDRYTHPTQDITYGQEYILTTFNSHWRSAESTTGTFAIKSALFLHLKSKLMYWCENGNRSPDDRSFYRDIVKNNNIRLFTPILGYSTHCVKHFLTPFVDWLSVNNTL